MLRMDIAYKLWPFFLGIEKGMNSKNDKYHSDARSSQPIKNTISAEISISQQCHHPQHFSFAPPQRRAFCAMSMGRKKTKPLIQRGGSCPPLPLLDTKSKHTPPFLPVLFLPPPPPPKGAAGAWDAQSHPRRRKAHVNRRARSHESFFDSISQVGAIGISSLLTSFLILSLSWGAPSFETA